MDELEGVLNSQQEFVFDKFFPVAVQYVLVPTGSCLKNVPVLLRKQAQIEVVRRASHESGCRLYGEGFGCWKSSFRWQCQTLRKYVQAEKCAKKSGYGSPQSYRCSARALHWRHSKIQTRTFLKGVVY